MSKKTKSNFLGKFFEALSFLNWDLNGRNQNVNIENQKTKIRQDEIEREERRLQLEKDKEERLKK